MAESDRDRGLYGKFRVERVDGKDKGPYFVLGYATDPHARSALATYAAACRDEYPTLAADLRAELLKHEPPARGGSAGEQRLVDDKERAFVHGLDSQLEGFLDYVAAEYPFPLTDENALAMCHFFVDELNNNPSSRYLIAQALTAAAVRLTAAETTH